MENDKEWEFRSDEWVESMNESRLLKKQRLDKKLANSDVKESHMKAIERYAEHYSYVVKKSG